MIRALCVLMLSISPVFAAQLPVTSGEHNGFSRIVLPIPRGSEWTIDGDDDQYTLSVSPHQDGFNLRRAFDLIPRTRLARLTGGPDRLVLDLACDCGVTAEYLTNGYLVIDIADPVKTAKPADPPPEFSNVLPVTLPREQKTLQQAGDAGTRPRVDVFRHTVLEQISRAASQDLIDVSTPPPVPQTELPDAEAPVVAEPPLGATSPISPPEKPRLAVTNALQEALKSLDRIDRKGATACYDPEFFDVAAWADDTGFSANASRHRMALMGEFDRLDTASAWALLRVYLRFGLVEEVQLMLDGFALSGPAADATHAIGAVLEGKMIASDHPFLAMLDCDPTISTWVAASGQAPAISDTHAQAIAPVFSALPIELRALLAPRLIRAFEGKELYAEAQIIRASVGRVDAESETIALTRQFSTDPDKMTNEALFDVVAANTDQSPEALAIYIDRQLDTDGVPNADLQTLAQAYIAELDGTPVAADLERLDIKLTSRKGGFLVAFAASIGDQYLMRNLADDLLARGQDSDLALFASKALTSGQITHLTLEHREDFARRLGEMGLPELAMAVLGGKSDTSDLQDQIGNQLRRNADITPSPDETLAAFRDARPLTIEPTLGAAAQVVTQSAELTRAIEALLATQP